MDTVAWSLLGFGSLGWGAFLLGKIRWSQRKSAGTSLNATVRYTEIIPRTRAITLGRVYLANGKELIIRGDDARALSLAIAAQEEALIECEVWQLDARGDHLFSRRSVYKRMYSKDIHPHYDSGCYWAYEFYHSESIAPQHVVSIKYISHVAFVDADFDEDKKAYEMYCQLRDTYTSFNELQDTIPPILGLSS